MKQKSPTEQIRDYVNAHPPKPGEVGYYDDLVEKFKHLAVNKGQVRWAVRGTQYAGVVGSYHQHTTARKNKVVKAPSITEQIYFDKKEEYYKTKITQLQRKNKELIRDSIASDRLIAMARESISAIPPSTAPRQLNIKSRDAIESVVMVGSCWHIGEVVNKQQMNGLNEYNFDIFCRRLQYFVDKTIKFTKQNMQMHQFDELRILLTGDMVSGIIHEELSETNELNIVEQATLGAYVTAQAIRELASVFPRVIITGVVGNHGRVQKQKYFKNKQQVNWDYIFYTYLSLMLAKQTNVSFQIPLSFWVGVDIKGHRFLITHGDLIRSWGGIPFYGIQRAVSKWLEVEAVQNKFFDYFIASHFHNRAILQKANGESILNASMKGGDEYAIGLGLYSKPEQLIFGVHAKHKKTWSLAIDTSQGDNTPTRYIYDRTQSLIDQAKH